MAYDATLCTEAEFDLAVGENPSANQTDADNAAIWVKWAEGDISAVLDNDIVANYGSVKTNWKRYLARIAAMQAASYAIHEHPDQWQLATTQTKLNKCDDSWASFERRMEKHRADLLTSMGL